MVQYKTVAGPAAIQIGKRDSYNKAVESYASIIQQEALQGWELAFIQEIPVERNKGCLAALGSIIGLCTAYEVITFNMLVFKREV